MSSRESTSVPSRSHTIVVIVMISPRATCLPSHVPIALVGLRDYTHAIDRSCMPGDTAEGISCAHGPV